jgi:hypothetical protein
VAKSGFYAADSTLAMLEIALRSPQRWSSFVTVAYRAARRRGDEHRPGADRLLDTAGGRVPRARGAADPHGKRRERFGDVIVKELIDNALDACEAAGVAPEIQIGGDDSHVWVADNGPGVRPEIIERVLDFNVLVSDKAAYRSPTRGQQGQRLEGDRRHPGGARDH